MFYWLIQKFIKYNTGFNAFTYLSSRAILAMMSAIILSMILYPPIIKWLRSIKLGQPIRELGPSTHFEKKGTPTMGGIIIIFSTLVSCLLWIDFNNVFIWSLVFIMLSFASVGFIDDYLKISKKNSSGLSSKMKMLSLIFFSSFAIWFHFSNLGQLSHASTTILYLPFFKDLAIDLGFFYFPFVVFVLVGSSNAVNLTDGLDGLVIGPVITCSIALLILSYVTGNSVLAKYLYYHTIPGSGEITVFLAALIGSSIGFLWFNTWPAEVFMGDSGALPLGGILGMVSVQTGHEILLSIMGAVFVAEALSVIIQVYYFKKTGKRVFLMAPIHHHYEKSGWPEQKITIRMWIISLMLALLSILTLKLR